MAFTSPGQVQSIIELRRKDAADADAVLQPFIDTAGSLVTRLCTNSGYTEDDLELIERWLAAHFYAVSRPKNKSEGISGGPNAVHEDLKVDLMLKNTKWGQMALVLDTAGNLAAYSNRMATVTSQKPSVAFVGSRRHHHRGEGCP